MEKDFEAKKRWLGVLKTMDTNSDGTVTLGEFANELEKLIKDAYTKAE